LESAEAQVELLMQGKIFSREHVLSLCRKVHSKQKKNFAPHSTLLCMRVWSVNAGPANFDGRTKYPVLRNQQFAHFRLWGSSWTNQRLPSDLSQLWNSRDLCKQISVFGELHQRWVHRKSLFFK
jgi:hypothetical protein